MNKIKKFLKSIAQKFAKKKESSTYGIALDIYQKIQDEESDKG